MRYQFKMPPYKIVESGCWECTNKRIKDGYCQSGQLGRKGHPSRTYYSHRVSYMIFKGDILKGMTVDHMCKNRSCINPNHLRLLSPADNARDRLDAKLSIPKAIRIRNLYASGIKQYELGRMFNIDQAQISRVINGKAWI